MQTDRLNPNPILAHSVGTHALPLPDVPVFYFTVVRIRPHPQPQIIRSVVRIPAQLAHHAAVDQGPGRQWAPLPAPVPARDDDRAVGLHDGTPEGQVFQQSPEEGGEAFARLIVEGVVDLGVFGFAEGGFVGGRGRWGMGPGVGRRRYG